ncbi:hypothetical protein CDD81_3039 [Ophiocordyceps australis]|uniref:Uncharacterized protein n=1 Tax=Ophiocordyceps australis TaxID=1399860 RepID=A0A2C5YIF2_9HYPO|nr:hypothetical protein CDD81_3039 [Ophiocordyceps australis]
MKATLEKTWLLQDRLVFPNKVITLLFICLQFTWQKIKTLSDAKSRDLTQIPRAEFALSDIFSFVERCINVLCLATAGKADPVYIIQACIDLDRAKVENVDSGGGLQCHTAPFSWKLVFECNHQLYEVIMTACTPKEEMEWRTRLARPCKEGLETRDAHMYSSLDLNLKSLGTVFGRPGTLARRVSIHRATTVGPKTPTCQVLLKNTSVVRDSTANASMASTLNRSQSMLLNNARMSVLAPARSERAKLEALLADVWSREVLPFPGMTTRARSEHLVRTSASTVMRKLSVASITSSFSRRSGSTSHKSKSVQDCQKGIVSKRRAWKSLSEDASTDCSNNMEATVDRGSKRPRTGQTSRPRAGAAGISRAAEGKVRRSKTVTESTETRTMRVSSATGLQCSQSVQLAACFAEPNTKHESEAHDRTMGRSRRGRGGSHKNDATSHNFKSLFR